MVGRPISGVRRSANHPRPRARTWWREGPLKLTKLLKGKISEEVGTASELRQEGPSAGGGAAGGSRRVVNLTDSWRTGECLNQTTRKISPARPMAAGRACAFSQKRRAHGEWARRGRAGECIRCVVCVRPRRDAAQVNLSYSSPPATPTPSPTPADKLLPIVLAPSFP
jgi:hypothetical protein